MAGKDTINFDVNFNNRGQATLKEIQKELQYIKDLTTYDIEINYSDKNYSELERDLEKAKSSAEALSKAFDKSFNNKLGTVNVQEFNKALGKTDLKSLYQDMSKIGSVGSNAFRHVTSQVLATQAPIKQTNKVLNEMANSFKNVAKYQINTRIFQTLTGSISSALGYIKELDTSLNHIQIVTGNSAEQMAQFAVQANNAAKQLGQTTTAYADAALIFAQQGLGDADIAERTEVTLKMMNVLGESASVASENLTAIINNFSDGTQTAESFIDVVTALGATTASSADEIATGISKFASVADTVGMSYEYATASVATLVAATRQSADTVGTAMKTLLARIQDLEQGATLDDGVTLGKYSQALEKVGVQVMDVNGNVRQMDDILDDVAAKWDTLSQAQQAALAQNVAGQRQYTFFTSLMENWDKMEQNISTAGNALGTLDEQNDIYLNSLEAHMNQLKAASEDLYDSFFNSDSYKGLIDIGTTLTQIFADFIDTIGGGGNALLLLGGILTKVFSGQIANQILGIKNAFNEIKNSEQMMSENLQFASKLQQMIAEINAADDAMLDLLEVTARYSKEVDIAAQKGIINEEQYNQLKGYISELDSVAQKYQEIDNLRMEASNALMSANGTNIFKDKEQHQIENNKEFKENYSKINSDLNKVEKVFNQLAKNAGAFVDSDKKKNFRDVQRSKDFLINSNALQQDQKDELKENFQEVDTAREKRDALKTSNKNITDAETNYQTALKNLANKIKADDFAVEQLTEEEKILYQELAKRGEVAKVAATEEQESKAKMAQSNAELEQAEKELAEAERYAAEQVQRMAEGHAEDVRNVRKQMKDQQPNVEHIDDNMGSAKEGLISKLSGLVDAQKIQEGVKAVSQLSMGITGLVSVGSSLKNLFDDTVPIGDRLLQFMMSLGMSLPMVISGFEGLTAAAGLLGASVGALAVPLVAVIALFTAFSFIDSHWSFGAKIKKAQESMEGFKQATENAKQEYSNLQETVSNYKDAENAIDNLTSGTQEWRDAISECNAQVIQLLETYPELAKYLNNDNGRLTIDEEGFEEVNKQLVKKAAVTQMAQGVETESANELKWQQKVGNDSSEKYVADRLAEIAQKDDNLIPALTEAISKVQNGEDVNNDPYLGEIANRFSMSAEDFVKFLNDNELVGEISKLSAELSANTEAISAMKVDAMQNMFSTNDNFNGLDDITQNLVSTIGANLAYENVKNNPTIDNKEDAQKYLLENGQITQKDIDDKTYSEDQLLEMANISAAMEAQNANLANVISMAEKVQDAGLQDSTNGEANIGNLTSGEIDKIKGEDGVATSDEVAKYFASKGIEGDVGEEIAKSLNFDGLQDMIDKTTAAVGEYGQRVEKLLADAPESVKKLFSEMNTSNLSENSKVDILNNLQQALANGGIGEMSDLANQYANATAQGEDAVQAVSNAWADAMNSAVKSVQDLKSEFAGMQGIIDKVAGGTKNITEEEYNKLGKAGKSYFTQMADGTYQLIGNAQEFQKVANTENRQGFVNKVESGKSDIATTENAIKGLKNRGNLEGSYRDRNSLGIEAGEDGFTANQAAVSNVQEKIDAIKAAGEDVAEFQAKLNDLSISSKELQQIDDKFKGIDTTVEELNGTLESQNAEQQEAMNLLATTATNAEELDGMYANGDEHALINNEAYENGLRAIASQYENTTGEIDKYNEALKRRNELEQQKQNLKDAAGNGMPSDLSSTKDIDKKEEDLMQGATADLKVAEDSGVLANKYGLDAEGVELIADEQLENLKEADELMKAVGDDESQLAGLAAGLAGQNARLNKGVEDLKANSKDYKDVLKELNKNGKSSIANNSKMLASYKAMRKDLADITGQTEEFADKLLESSDNVKLMEKAMNGDQEAVDDLNNAAQDMAATDIADSMGLSDSETKGLTDNLDALQEKAAGLNLGEALTADTGLNEAMSMFNTLSSGLDGTAESAARVGAAMAQMGVNMNLARDASKDNLTQTEALAQGYVMLTDEEAAAMNAANWGTNVTDNSTTFKDDDSFETPDVSVSGHQVHIGDAVIPTFGTEQKSVGDKTISVPKLSGHDTSPIMYPSIDVNPKTDNTKAEKDETRHAYKVTPVKGGGGKVSGSNRRARGGGGGGGGGKGGRRGGRRARNIRAARVSGVSQRVVSRKNTGTSTNPSITQASGSLFSKSTIGKANSVLAKAYSKTRSILTNDPLKETDTQLSRLEKTLKRISGQADHLLGKALLKNMREQRELIKQQNKELSKQANILSEVTRNERAKNTRKKVYAGEATSKTVKKEKISWQKISEIENDNFGFKFDNETGLITNREDLISDYWKVYQKALTTYNNIREKSKKENKNWKENDKKAKAALKGAEDAYKAAQKNAESAEKWADEYEKLLEQDTDLRDSIKENIYNQIQLVIDEIDAKVQLDLDVVEAQSTWNDFIESINGTRISLKLDDDGFLEDGFEKNLQGLTDYTINAMNRIRSMNSNKNAITTSMNELNKATEEYSQIQQYDGQDLNEVFTTEEEKKAFAENNRFAIYSPALKELVYDAAAAQETMKTLQSNVMDNITALKETLDKLAEDWSSSLDEISSKYDFINQQYEDMNSALEESISLTKLLNGETGSKARDKINKAYQDQVKNIKNQIDSQKNIADSYKYVMEQAKNTYGELSSEYQEAYEKWVDASSRAYQTLETGLQNLADQYENTIEAIFEKTVENFASEIKSAYTTLESMESDWELSKNVSDAYLDTVNTAYQLSALQYKYTKAIDSNSNASSQAKLKKIMDEELANLEKQDKLSQYDLDRANKKYEIALKEMELEEARDNKSTMRLRRDANGNYSYVYTANENKIDELKDELAGLKNELYNFDKDYLTTVTADAEKYYSEWVEAAKEVYQDTTLSEEQRQQKLVDITNKYQKLIVATLEEASKTQVNIIQSANEDIEMSVLKTAPALEAWANGIQSAFMQDDGLMYFNSSLSEFVRNMEGQVQPDGALGVMQKVLADLDEAYKEHLGNAVEMMDGYSGVVSEGATASEQYENAIDNVTNALAGEGGLADAINQVLNDKENNISSLTDALKSQTDFINDEYDKALKTIINDYSEMFKAAEKAIDKAAELQKVNSSGGPLGDEKTTGDNEDGTDEVEQYPEIGPDPKSRYISARLRKRGKKTSVKKYYSKKTATRKKIFRRKRTGTVIGKGTVGRKYLLQVKIGKRKVVYKRVRRKTWEKYDTGGYTGAWGNSGKLAMLHEKELVLNKKDTQNILDVVSMVRQMVNTQNIGNNIMNRIQDLTNSLNNQNVARQLSDVANNTQNIAQTVNVNADFSGVNSAIEIENAINSLKNSAIQYINRK